VDKTVNIHLQRKVITKQNTNQNTGKRAQPNPDSAGRAENTQKSKGLIQGREARSSFIAL